MCHNRKLSQIIAVLAIIIAAGSCTNEKEPGLVGYWKLQGDSKDHSGNGNDATNHGVGLDSGTFAKKGWLEVAAGPSLALGVGDFSFSAWVYLPEKMNDIGGDIMEMYDPATRKGITLSIGSSAGGYQCQGTDRNIYFGIDNARLSEWEDCGRPNATSNYIGNSLTVFKGKLYAVNFDATDKKDWAHVYSYDGGQKWTDCGRVGDEKTTGVGGLIVHNGELYAATSTYDWTRVWTPGAYDPGKVYRYLGGTSWEPISNHIDSNRTLTTLASFDGKLFVGSGPHTWAVFTQDTGKQWKISRQFEKEGPLKCFPHTSRVYRDKLYVGFPSVYSYDGKDWAYSGVPSEPESTLQTHSLTVFRGNLVAGTWPLAIVSRFEGDKQWKPFGRVGHDGTEVNALVVYNGKLYGGSIPRATVARYDDADSVWTTLKQFYSPPGWTPVPPVENTGKNPTDAEVNEWTRVTSLTVFNGRLYASIGSCTSAQQDAPADIRGTVLSMEAGKNISYDDNLGHGWKHVTAIKQGGQLKLYIDGKLAKTSGSFDPKDYDLTVNKPLLIGHGQTDYFVGKMADVRLYNIAISENRISELAASKPN